MLKFKVSQRALNRLIWGADGRRIVTGDAAGYVYLHDIGDVIFSSHNIFIFTYP